MIFTEKDKFKYKLMSLDELVINLDRLTRFKLPEESYFRVFSSILYKNLITPKLSKNEIEKLPANTIGSCVQTIWNESVRKILKKEENNLEINKVIKLLLNFQFKNTDDETKRLINTKLSISPILNTIDYEKSPINLKFLIKANKTFSKKNPATIKKIEELREKNLLKFPITKLLIVEGITEEILLPVFAAKLHSNFEQKGIYILGAGGKSKSPDLYLKLKEKLKIPVLILFDNDAQEIYELLKQNLLKKDKTIIIKKGEFEDIISLNLLKRSINKEYINYDKILKKDLQIYNRMCQNIEYYYRTRKLGEFKKAKLAKLLAENVKYNTDITEEIKTIIKEIVV
ncbi:ATP-dependent endonuclease [bacterium]|nr:ATP-dependent endonuclease [bacterium]